MLVPIEEMIENDPRLKAMVEASPERDRDEQTQYMEALRDYSLELQDEHACFDPYGYIEDGMGRVLRFRLGVVVNPRDLATWDVEEVELLGDAAAAKDAHDLQACLDALFLSTHPPRASDDFAERGDIFMRWAATGHSLERVPLTMPASAGPGLPPAGPFFRP